MRRYWTILLPLVCLQQTLTEAPEGGAAPDGGAALPKFPDPEFQQLFMNFFDTADGAKYFFKFVEEGKKAFKLPSQPGMPTEPSTETSTEKSEAAKAEEITHKPPLAGKVFAFFGKVYGCQHSKVYKAFLIDWKSQAPFFPKEPDASVEDKWLQKMAEAAETITTEEDSSVAITEAENKINGLTPNQRDILTKGEDAMPLACQIYLHVIRALGCSSTNEEKYNKIKEVLKGQVEKVNAKPPKTPPTVKYWLIKVDAIVLDLKEE